MKWSTACPDWRERIIRRESLIPFPPLFPDEAEAALKVFKALKVVDLPGEPTFGECSRQWVFDFVAAIFGSYDPDAGRRLINDYFLLISKKNTKSTIAAGIMVTALIRNWRGFAELNILAPTLEIAKNSAAPAMGMVQRDQELMEILRPVPHERVLQHRTTKAELKIVAADAEVVGGKKSSFILVDELWLFGKIAKAEDMLREATGGLASRPEGFQIALSTESDEPPAGVFKDTLQRFRDIRDGKLEAPRALGVLYEYPEHMLKSKAYEKPENFYITNPNLGASVDEQYLLDEFEKSRAKGVKSLVGFFAKHLNVEVGLALRSDRWAGADFWQQAEAAEIVDLENILARCDVVTVGIDGGGLDDLLGLAVLGRETNTRRWLLWVHAWAYSIVLERRKDIATVLLDFERQENLTIVAVPGQDVTDVADIVEQIHQSGLLPAKNGVGVDPVGIAQIVDEIVARGVPQETVVGVSQGWKLSGAIKTAERGLNDGTLVHAAQPIMAWAVSNAKVEPRGNAVTITKQAAGSMKIDPLMAAFNAVALMSMNPEGKRSIYEDRPLLVL